MPLSTYDPVAKTFTQDLANGKPLTDTDLDRGFSDLRADLAPVHATTTTPGIVKPDGTTITVQPDGTITAVGGGSGASTWSAVTGKPTFATVATSGSYNDLTNQPTFLTIGQTASTVSAGAVAAAPTGAVVRSHVARLSDTVNVADYGADPTGAADSATAFNAAYAAIPASGGRVFVPHGNYTLATPLTWGGKSVEVIGTRQTILTPTHTGSALTIAQTSLLNTTTVRDLTFVAGCSTGPTALALAITYPIISSYPLRTADIENVNVVSSQAGAANASAPNAFLAGFDLQGLWAAKIVNCRVFVINTATPTAGTYGFRFGGCIALDFLECSAQGAAVAFLQNGYCEGLKFAHCDVLCAQGYVTGTFSTTFPARSNLNGIELEIVGGEWNCFNNALSITKISQGTVTGGARIGLRNDATGNTCITLSDTFEFSVNNSTLYGGGGPLSIGVLLTGTGGTHTCIISNNVMSYFTGTLVKLDSTTLDNQVFGNFCFNAPATVDALYVDQGTNNDVSWPLGGGGSGVGTIGNYYVAGAAGQPLVVIPQVPAAVNYVDLTAAAAGASPYIGVVGNDTNVDLTLNAKGTGLVRTSATIPPNDATNAFVTSAWVQSRIPAVVAPSAVNFIGVSQTATGASPFMSATGADANIDLTINAKGAGLVKTSNTIPVGDNSNAFATTAWIQARGTSAYSLPVATGTVLGGVKQGAGVTIAGDGTLTVSGSYTLPTASTTVLGGVKVDGTTITIASGVISASGGGAALSSAAPVADGTAAAGTATTASRADHVHPTDTSRLGTSALPAAAGLYGGTGTAGQAVALTVGAGLTLTGTTLTASGGASSNTVVTFTADGTLTSFTVTHGLGTAYLLVSVMDASGLVQAPDITLTTTQAIIAFASPPPAQTLRLVARS